MPRGRRKPYTAIGIKRCKCWRCGAPAQQQWSVCADGNIQRPICNPCDIALNALVLRWAGDPAWRSKVAAYRRQLMARYPSKKRDPKKVAKKAAAKKGKAPAKKAAAKPSSVAARSADGVRRAREALDKAQYEAVAVAVAEKPSRWHRFRCAITGLFTGRKHAEANPATTVRERVR